MGVNAVLIVGTAAPCRLAVAEAEQVPSDAVIVREVIPCGALKVKEGLSCPLLHVYEFAPVAVKVTAVPAQARPGETPAETRGSGRTVTLMAAVDWHPERFLPVTE